MSRIDSPSVGRLSLVSSCATYGPGLRSRTTPVGDQLGGSVTATLSTFGPPFPVVAIALILLTPATRLMWIVSVRQSDHPRRSDFGDPDGRSAYRPRQAPSAPGGEGVWPPARALTVRCDCETVRACHRACGRLNARRPGSGSCRRRSISWSSVGCRRRQRLRCNGLVGSAGVRCCTTSRRERRCWVPRSAS